MVPPVTSGERGGWQAGSGGPWRTRSQSGPIRRGRRRARRTSSSSCSTTSASQISAATARRSAPPTSTGWPPRAGATPASPPPPRARPPPPPARNHHSVGVGCLANFDSGYPGYRGKIAKEAGTLPEMLRPHGYRNYMLGKWHVTNLTETGPSGPFDGWPLGRGFDRFFGFMDAEADQYAPPPGRPNPPLTPPGTFQPGYH